MARRKKLVDCSVRCNGDQYDFSVWPRKGQTSRDACLSKGRFISNGKSCEVLRSRSIDGVKKASSMGSQDVTVSAAKALRACRVSVDPDCQDACRFGIRALEQEMKRKPSLSGSKRYRIIPED